MPAATIKNMSVGELLTLRTDIESLLRSKRTELESQLEQIGGVVPKRPVTVKAERAKVTPQYRHPSTGETWSGRGATVRWLAKEIADGKKKEDFRISDQKKQRRKKSA